MMIEYQGKKLTPLEWRLVEYLENERNRIDNIETEKADVRKFLAKKSLQIETSGYNAKPTPQKEPAKREATPSEEHSQPKKIAKVEKPTPIAEEEEEVGFDNLAAPVKRSTESPIEEETPGLDILSQRRIKKREEDDEEDLVISPYFSSEKTVDIFWDSTTAESNKEIPLPQFSQDANNTLGLKMEIPTGSRGWAINICPKSDIYNVDVLFHFNPRYSGKQRKIVMNDRLGTWSQGTDTAIHAQSAILAETLDVKIQIRSEGFLVHCNDQLCTFFAHRREIKGFDGLKLVLMPRDDNGNPLPVKVNQYWWGHLDLENTILSMSVKNLIRKSVEEAQSTESYLNPTIPRTAVATGLPILYDLEELQGIEYLLLDVFEKYKPKVSLVTGAGIGYIKLPLAGQLEEFVATFNLYSFQDENEVTYTIHLQPMATYIPEATTQEYAPQAGTYHESNLDPDAGNNDGTPYQSSPSYNPSDSYGGYGGDRRGYSADPNQQYPPSPPYVPTDVNDSYGGNGGGSTGNNADPGQQYPPSPPYVPTDPNNSYGRSEMELAEPNYDRPYDDYDDIDEV